MTSKNALVPESPALQKPIAVVGVGALFPGSSDAAGFWNDILAAKDLITEVPTTHWLPEDFYDPNPATPDKAYGKRGGFLSPVDFDPLEIGMPPNTIPATDTAQMLAVIVAQKVLEDAARGQFRELDRDRISVILGVAGATELLGHMIGRMQRPQWVKGLRESGIPEDEVQQICDRVAKSYLPWQESTFPGLLGNVVAGRVANRLNLGGSNCVVDAACAGSLAAVSMAINELHTGQSDLVLTGGVDALNDPLMYMCFSKTPALSPTGDCRPFSDKADGTILGEGIGMVALRRLEDAQRDGNRIYAVLRGLGSSSDGKAKSIYAPVPEGQAKALRRTYAGAGYGPETVELVEAHGTGTNAGDAAEMSALKTVFQESGREDANWCAIGSVKSQIGHTKGAAGSAGLFKAVMALHHKVLPPTAKVDRPNPKLGIDASPFYINSKARPWIRGSAHPRRASVSAFGFGGSNFHVTLEEYAGDQPALRMRSSPSELVVLHAATPAQLSALCKTTTGPFAAVARKTQERATVDREASDAVGSMRCRIAIVAASDEDLRAKLDRAAARIGETAWADPSGIYYGVGEAPGPVALLFPGQGSQYVEMGSDLAIHFDLARAVWDRLADVPLDGTRLDQVVFPKPVFDAEARAAQEKRLTATEWAQPALGAASASQLAILRALGISYSCVGGHSFGEVSALHAAGVLDEAGMLAVARRRGELMAAAASAVPGTMTAVSHDPAALAVLLEGSGVVVANQNSPKQAVISGRTAAIEAVEKTLGAKKINFKRLPVATAFHSEVVSASARPFRDHLEGVAFAAAKVPVYANTTAAPYPDSPAEMKDLLAGQIARPVRFAEQIDAMYASGARIFIEVGASSVLSRLTDECLEGKPHLSVSLDRKGQSGLTSLWQGIGQLWSAGVPMLLSTLWAPFRREEPPKKRSSTTIQINGANYAKPYPPLAGAAALPKPNPPRPKQLPAAVPASLPPPVARVASAPVLVRAPDPLPAPPTPAVALALAPAIAPAAPTTTPMPQTPSPALLAVFDAVRETQKHAAEAHAAFQSQLARTSESLLRTMEALSAGAAATAAMPAAGATIALPAAAMTPAPAMLPVPVLAAAPSAFEPAVAAPPAPAPALRAVASLPDPVRKSSTIDLNQLLLEIVAEKTGYPADVLTPDMELEAGLGIDSIKRVEILSAMQDRVPGLPAVKASEMATLRTLGEIVSYMEASGASPSAKAPEASAPALTVVATPPPMSTGVDLHQLLLEIVAEKTGYPADVLTAEMELEAGLGIDSIKRVEILSAMQDRVPGLPAVKASEMAALRTLGEIVAYMEQSGRGKAPAAAAAEAEIPAAPVPDQVSNVVVLQPKSTAVDLHRLLLEIVAEKTGYPADVLTAEMELEAGLGIDSIKRVEILSAMQDRAPGLPAVKASEMAALRTLGEIVAYMESGSSHPQAATLPAAPSASGNHSANAPAISRLALRLVDAPASGFALAGLFAGTISVSEDRAGVAHELVGQLLARGVAAALGTNASARGAIFLGGLREIDSVETALAVNRSAFQTAKELAEKLSQGSGLFVTVQDTGGNFGLSGAGDRAWLAGLTGLVKTAAREWPQASVRALDLERAGRTPAELACAIVEELFAGGSELEVALRANGSRSTLGTEASSAEGTPRAVVDEHSVILASGGARGVTAATLIALAQRSPARFVLLGRTEAVGESAGTRAIADEVGLKRALIEEARAAGSPIKPAEVSRQVASILAAREIEATLAALRATGSEARYLACDVQDAEALGRALAPVRAEWGAFTGLVHGAGVLADKAIAEKTQEQFDRVFETKIAGLRALLAATEHEPLRFIALFSSVAARYGNAGQCDYAMANEVLNKVAASEASRRSNCLVKSLNWGPWEGGMVTPALAGHFRERGISLIPLEAGARAFVDELFTSPAGEIEVVLGAPITAQAAEASTFSVHVSAASHAYLADHTVKGTPVVPAVLVMEWFARAARAQRPELSLAAVRDLRVLNGIRLTHFNDGELLHILVKPAAGEGTRFDCELRGPDRRICYSGQVELGASPSSLNATAEDLAALSPERGGRSPWSVAEIYDGAKLFHGPRFQVIAELTALDNNRAVARISSTEAMGWREESFLIDPAALDGALQLARLCGLSASGRGSLPTSIGEALFTARSGAGPLRCIVRTRLAGSHRTLSEVRFFASDGALVAALNGVEMHLLAEAAEPAEHENAARKSGVAS